MEYSELCGSVVGKRAKCSKNSSCLQRTDRALLWIRRNYFRHFAWCVGQHGASRRRTSAQFVNVNDDMVHRRRTTTHLRHIRMRRSRHLRQENVSPQLITSVISLHITEITTVIISNKKRIIFLRRKKTSPIVLLDSGNEIVSDCATNALCFCIFVPLPENSKINLLLFVRYRRGARVGEQLLSSFSLLV